MNRLRASSKRCSVDEGLTSLDVVGGGVVQAGGFIDGIGGTMGGGVVLVLVRRSHRVVEEECVTLMSCCPRIFHGFGEGHVVG